MRGRLWPSALLVAVSGAVVVIASATRLSPAPESAEAPDGGAAGGGPGARPAVSALPTGSAEADDDPDAGVAASCRIPDRGLGTYRGWRRLSIGAVLVPEPPPPGPYNLLVHFHGAEAARKLLAPAGLRLVIVGLDAGEGSQRYEEAFYGPAALDELLEGVQEVLTEAGSARPELRHLIVTSWSAGYGAVRQVLLHHAERPAAVLLLDSLHASYSTDQGELVTDGLEPFVELARRAAKGRPMLFMTHSEIRPPDYASTSETATYLLGELGAQRRYAGLVPVAGVEHKTSFEQGALFVRGFTGVSREAHCAHLLMLLPIVRDEVLPALRRSPDAG